MIPRRLKRESKEFALVDGIPFALPVRSRRMQALMAAFPVDPDSAQALLPAITIHVARLWLRALLVVTVVNFDVTGIGRYFEVRLTLDSIHHPHNPHTIIPFQSAY